MAKTSKERAAEMRLRRVGEKRQLSSWISATVYDRLKEMARLRCRTIGEAIEHLVDADSTVHKLRERIKELERDLKLWQEIAMDAKQDAKPKKVDKTIRNKIIRGIHPDRRKAVTDDELSEALRLFNEYYPA